MPLERPLGGPQDMRELLIGAISPATRADVEARSPLSRLVKSPHRGTSESNFTLIRLSIKFDSECRVWVTLNPQSRLTVNSLVQLAYLHRNGEDSKPTFPTGMVGIIPTDLVEIGSAVVANLHRNGGEWVPAFRSESGKRAFFPNMPTRARREQRGLSTIPVGKGFFPNMRARASESSAALSKRISKSLENLYLRLRFSPLGFSAQWQS